LCCPGHGLLPFGRLHPSVVFALELIGRPQPPPSTSALTIPQPALPSRGPQNLPRGQIEFYLIYRARLPSSISGSTASILANNV
jgi:hypothetical protein